MKTYGAFFYLTFGATDSNHAETIAAAIVTTHNPDGEAHMQPGTLLPAQEEADSEIEDAWCGATPMRDDD